MLKHNFITSNYLSRIFLQINVLLRLDLTDIIKLKQ